MWDRINKGLYWDRAWSLVDGCTPVSEGCEHCWSAAIARRFGSPLIASGHWSGDVVYRENRLDLPSTVKKPTIFAVWNDLFHEAVSNDFIAGALRRMFDVDRHIYLILTKRADRMLERMGTLSARPHIWLGVTAENQKRAQERIPYLIEAPAAVRFVSVEPMLGPVDLNLMYARKPGVTTETLLDHLDWIICGPETGPGARPCHPGWVLELAAQCGEAHVPFFFKGWNRKGKRVIEPGWLQVPEAPPRSPRQRGEERQDEDGKGSETGVGAF